MKQHIHHENTEAGNRALVELDEYSKKFKQNEAAMSDLIDVVGVVASVKPSAFINAEVIGHDVLSRLGLAYATSQVKNILYVSPRKKTAKRLAALHEMTWGKNAEFPDENREIGKLLGYPETATEYFLARLSVYGTPKELPIIRVKRTMNTVSEEFQSLILSPEHYEAELASYCEPLEAAVRELAPKTYRALQRNATRKRHLWLLKRLVGKGDASYGMYTKAV